MAYVVTTPLGREVALDDWRNYHRDAVLRLLYDHAGTAQFDPGVALVLLQRVTGLPAAEVQGLCTGLKAEGLVDLLPGDRVRLSDEGKARVLALLRAA